MVLLVLRSLKEKLKFKTTKRFWNYKSYMILSWDKCLFKVNGTQWIMALIVFTLQKKWSFPLRISLSNMTKSVETADLVTFTEEILNGNLIFLCTVTVNNQDARLMSVLVCCNKFIISWTIYTIAKSSEWLPSYSNQSIDRHCRSSEDAMYSDVFIVNIKYI